MRAIIIYYSYSGNTKKASDILADYLGQNYEVKIVRLVALDEASSFLKQATRALFRRKARILPVEFDLSGYDLICLGTPVWAFAPAPAISAYLEDCIGLNDKPLVLFATYGSGAGLNHCLNYMQEVLSKKGARDFRKFSIQQFKVNNREFVNKAIADNLKL